MAGPGGQGDPNIRYIVGNIVKPLWQTVNALEAYRQAQDGTDPMLPLWDPTGGDDPDLWGQKATLADSLAGIRDGENLGT
jgi:hypothetical protein